MKRLITIMVLIALTMSVMAHGFCVEIFDAYAEQNGFVLDMGIAKMRTVYKKKTRTIYYIYHLHSRRQVAQVRQNLYKMYEAAQMLISCGGKAIVILKVGKKTVYSERL